MQSILKILARFMNTIESPTTRAMRGLRTGDQRALLTGAALVGFRWLRKSSGGRELIYRKEIPEGSAVVIRSGKKGKMPEIDVTRIDEIT